MRVRHLPPEDVSLLAGIDRSEHVDVQYAVRGGQLVGAPVRLAEIPTWPDDGGEHSISHVLDFCRPILADGATLLGAFDADDDALGGLAIVDPVFEPPLAWLALLYVDRRHRRTGVATALWAEAERLATAAGAAAMYVSATPTGSAVGFYLSRGCRLADPVHDELHRREPDDIHLVVDLPPGRPT
jgi:GNAT superfamily N-acetyltransferase